MKDTMVEKVRSTFDFGPVAEDKLASVRRIEELIIRKKLQDLAIPFQKKQQEIAAIEARYPTDGETAEINVSQVKKDQADLIKALSELETTRKTWEDAFNLAVEAGYYKRGAKKMEDFFPPPPAPPEPRDVFAAIKGDGPFE